MFAIDTSKDKGLDIVVLKDLSSKTYVEVVPSCGGILHSFNVLHNGTYLNVIDSYDSKLDFEKNVTAKGFKSCKLSPFACRINNARYKFGEEEYIVEKFLLGKNALHGLLYDADFWVTYLYADEDHAGLAIEYKYRGTDKGYPFYYDCLVTYHLKKNNELIVSTDIISREEESLIPVQDGWHPYFCFGGKVDDLLLEFQSKEKIIFNEAMIPTGKIERYEEYGSLKKIGDVSFDDCFTVNFAECQPLCVLRDPMQKIQVEIRPDKHYPFLQVYTPDHRRSIAIENLSAAPDCFNNGIGLIILPPQGNMVFNTSYTVTLL